VPVHVPRRSGRTAAGIVTEGVVAQAAAASIALWLIALAALTWSQVHVWRSSVSLWSTALDSDPSCAICHANLGVALFNLGQPGAAAEELEAPEGLQEAESELGINEWIDPDTGGPAEDNVPRIEDH